MSQRERRIVLWIAIFAFAMRLALVFRPEPRIYSRPYIDDTFYALGCAYHLAHGDGLTCDGVHPTNGIQPLIVFLETPLFVIAAPDKTLGVRLTIALEAVIDAMALFAFASLIGALRRESPKRKLTAPIIGALLWLALFNIFRQEMNGLETGLYAFLILITLNFYTRMRRPSAPLKQWAILGVILALLVLARIDAVFLIVGFILIELFRNKLRALLPLFVMGMMSILVSSPWWIFNYLTFGSIMPQSGQSEAIGVQLTTNLFSGTVALADILSAFFYFPYGDYAPWIHWVWFISVPAIILGLICTLKLVQKIKTDYNLRPLAPLAIASIGFVIFYGGFFAAWWFLYRYFHPIRILWTLLFAIGLESMIAILPGLKQVPRWILRGFGSAILLVALWFNANRYIANFTTDDVYPGYLIGKWALEHPTLRIGMEQSGTAGFVAPNVFNLDGKVNPDALAARKSGEIGKYIANMKFDYLADWELIVNTLVDKAKSAGAIYVRDSTIRTMVRYRRAP